jgi:2-oxo-3-hexenedioate decarboxylase
MTELGAIAAQLHEAARRRRPVSQFTDSVPGFDVEAAYEVQRELVRMRLDEGARLVGAKLGLTSSAKQVQMNVDSPLYGRLTSDMVLDPGEPVDLERFIHVRAEPEIGFLIGSEIAAPATIATVLAATESVFPAIELIDSRYDAFRFRLPDVVADNASSAGLIVGSVALPPTAAGDLRLLGVVLRRDGEVVATAAGAAALGHPAQAVAWLVGELAARGESLTAGSIVLSGALTDAIPLTAGSVVTAEIERLGVAEARA